MDKVSLKNTEGYSDPTAYEALKNLDKEITVMQKSNKSAKDLAFEKERAKYRKRIKECELLLKEKEKQLSEIEHKLPVILKADVLNFRIGSIDFLNIPNCLRRI